MIGNDAAFKLKKFYNIALDGLEKNILKNLFSNIVTFKLSRFVIEHRTRVD